MKMLITSGNPASKAKPVSCGGGRGAFVNCKPAKVYCSTWKNSQQFLSLGSKESASEFIPAGIELLSAHCSPYLLNLCPPSHSKKKERKENKNQVGRE